MSITAITNTKHTSPSRSIGSRASILALNPKPANGEAANDSTTFLSKCAEIREKLDGFGRTLAANRLAIADMFSAAKKLYDAEHGTGTPGKRISSSVTNFVKAVAKALDRSSSFVERYLRLAQLDSETRARIAGNLELLDDLTMLLTIARIVDPVKREAVITAYEHGGRKAALALLAVAKVAGIPEGVTVELIGPGVIRLNIGGSYYLIVLKSINGNAVNDNDRVELVVTGKKVRHVA